MQTARGWGCSSNCTSTAVQSVWRGYKKHPIAYTAGLIGAAYALYRMAGFAGLTTAYELVKRGYDVTVYEARNRVGGRVFSVLLQDDTGALQAAELGAQNICDGGDAKHLKTLAAELSLTITTTPLRHGCIGFFTEGKVAFPEEQLLSYFKSIFSGDGETNETDSNTCIEELLWLRLTALSMQSHTMEELLHTLFADNELLYQFFTLRLVCYEGGSTELLSPVYISTLYHMIIRKLHIEHQTTQASYMSIEGGNGKLAEIVAKRLDSRVHLNHVLTRIIKNHDGTYALQFHNGNVVTADIIVVTIPCPVYRDIIFEAGVISDAQLTTIRGIQYGGNAKILVPVSHGASPGTVGNEYAFAWKVGFHDPVTLFYREPYGRFTQEALSTVLARDLPLVSILHTIRNAAIHPCVARDESFAIYTGIVGHSWPLDPFAQGSYSYINAGKEEIFMAQESCASESVRTLFAPAGNLFFAGEHTTILLDVLGTMEAAVESGMRTAQMVDHHIRYNVIVNPIDGAEKLHNTVPEAVS